MDEATTQWQKEVSNCADEADSLQRDIDEIHHQLTDLVHTIRDLKERSFDDETEDYEILATAKALWNLVLGSAKGIRLSLQDTANDVNDLRRAVDFYR